MIQVEKQQYGTIWAIIGLVLAAGWVAFGMLGNGNTVFLTVMVILSLVLGGGAAIVLRARK